MIDSASVARVPYRGPSRDADARPRDSRWAETAAVHSLQAGDGAGLERLVDLHQARALRVAFAITGERSAAEDVVAEAFLRAFRRIQRFDPARPFGPWLLRIVTNEAIDMVGKQRRAHDLTRALWRQPQRVVDPGRIAEDNEQRDLLLALIQRLDARDRAAITLRYLLDLDERTVAETLGWPLGTLKTRLYRARRRLRQELGGDRHVFD